jgi:hypothetical protein
MVGGWLDDPSSLCPQAVRSKEQTMSWSAEELSRIGAADELEVSSYRPVRRSSGRWWAPRWLT